MGVDTGTPDAGYRADRYGEERARDAVLDVTIMLLDEVGYQHLRVEQVAARAGVPKVWLRRWWTTRPLLVAEALQRVTGPADVVPTGDVRTDVRGVVLRTAAYLANPVVGEALAGLTADAARDPVASERLAALLGARRSGDASVLLSAVARGDMLPGTDVPLVLDVVFGTLLFRLAAGITPTPEVVDTLVDLVLSGNAPRVERPGDAAVLEHGPDGHAIPGYALDGLALDAERLDAQGSDREGRDGYARDGYAPDANLFGGKRPAVNGVPFLPSRRASPDGQHALRDTGA